MFRKGTMNSRQRVEAVLRHQTPDHTPLDLGSSPVSGMHVSSVYRLRQALGLAPDGDPRHTHTAEGPDDMPAHLRSAVTRSSETIPIARGKLGLGTWQGVFLAEHRLGPHERRLIVHVTGA